MSTTSTSSTGDALAKPRAVRIALWTTLTLLGIGAVYLYAVRGNAIILDLSSGIAGLLCL